MKKNLINWVLLCVLMVLFIKSQGQILTFEFSSLAGNEATAASNFNHANLTASTISRGAGLTASTNAGRFNATNWALTSIDNAVSGNNYMEFSITPNSGYQFSVSSIVVQWQRSSTGNTAIALRSSVDSYASNLDAIKSVTDGTATQTFTWTFIQGNSTSTVTYRLYSYAEANTGSGGPGDGTGNDIIINGAVSSNTPTITVTPSSLTGFTYGQGNGPSAEQSFTVSGAALTADLTLTPPTNYEISTGTGGSFSATNPVTLTPSSGTVANTTIYVRLKAGLTEGTYNGETVTAASTGATSKTVTCDGNVSAPPAQIDWANLQWPLSGTINFGDAYSVYARVYEPGVTDAVGQGAGISAWIGFSTENTDPSTWTNWVVASFNADDGVNNDEYAANLGAALPTHGTYYYASRFKMGEAAYVYGGATGFWHAVDHPSGVLTVNAPPQLDWANLQHPENGSITLGGEFIVYAQVYEAGLTNAVGQGAGVSAWIGYNTDDTDPSTWTNWVAASYHGDNGNNDEYKADIGTIITPSGTYYYASRFKYGLADYVYGGYASGGGGFWESGVNVNGMLTVQTPEPSGQATGFSASSVPPTATAITLTWTDASPAAEHYLIKGSTVSYGAIVAPVDGTAESDALLVKNVDAGVQTAVFTGLTPETTYYFKIYPYNGTGALVNYKTDGSIPEASATTLENTSSYQINDFGFVAATGNWVTLTNWKQWDGSGWNNNPSAVPSLTDNVFILENKICTIEASGKNAKNITIESGAKLYTGNGTMTTPRYLNISGNISVEGTLGNGTGIDDVISLNIYGENTCTISGGGSFTANRLRRNNGTGTLNLIVNMDVELRYNGDALFNATTSPTSDQAFNIQVNKGKHLKLAGNGATPSSGYNLKSVDKMTVFGQLTVSGTLTNSAGNSGLVIKSTATGTGSLIHNTADVAATVERYVTGNSNLTEYDYHLVSVPLDAAVTNAQFMGSYLYHFDAATQSWTSNGTSTTAPVPVDAGYMIYYPNASTTYNFTGELNNGSFTAATGLDAADEFALVPNPYPSAIDWNAASGWTKTNLRDAIYVWDPVGNQYAAFGADAGINGGTRYIPAGQAFFVKSSAASTVLSMNNSVRVHNTQAFWKEGEVVKDLLRVKALGNGLSDELVLRFRQGTEAGLDLMDVDKLFGSDEAPQLFTLTADERQLSINTQPYSQQTVVVPMGFELKKDVEVSLHFSGIEAFEPTVNIFLEDSFTGQMINLRENPVYTFSHTQGNEPQRFKLHLMGVTAVGETPSAPAGQIWSDGNTLYLNFPELQGQKALYELFDLNGRLLESRELSPETIQRLKPQASGIVIARVSLADQVYVNKLFIR